MDKTRIYLIASTRPPEKTAAAITLARHLADDRLYDVLILPSDSHELIEPSFFRNILDRIQKTRFSKWVQDFRYMVASILPLHWKLPRPDKGQNKSVVLTVACGNGCLTAVKYASRYGLPLAVRFDDWWPDTLGLHPTVLTFYSRQFRSLTKAADLCFCISDGMSKEIGQSGFSKTILPIPEAGLMPNPPRPLEKPFRVCYLGNMFDYGPMLADLAEAALNVEEVRIEFRGTEPNWPIQLKSRLKNQGQLHGFLDGEEFHQWYESFDCYLVVMFFEESQRRRVRTCFATKLLDYSARGRPILIWAPEESSVVLWARKSGAAYCVTTADANAVVAALLDLSSDPQKCDRLGKLARRAYETEFSPDRLRESFDQAITQVAR